MPFQRKAGLGHYNATRDEWRAAYRTARVMTKVEPSCSSILWKAQLIVRHDRNPLLDPLSVTARVRLDIRKMIDEILG